MFGFPSACEEFQSHTLLYGRRLPRARPLNLPFSHEGIISKRPPRIDRARSPSNYLNLPRTVLQHPRSTISTCSDPRPSSRGILSNQLPRDLIPLTQKASDTHQDVPVCRSPVRSASVLSATSGLRVDETEAQTPASVRECEAVLCPPVPWPFQRPSADLMQSALQSRVHHTQADPSAESFDQSCLERNWQYERDDGCPGPSNTLEAQQP
jgi:hypothetical protein